MTGNFVHGGITMADDVAERILARTVHFLLKNNEGLCVEVGKGKYVMVKEDGELNCYNYDENKDSIFSDMTDFEDGRPVVFLTDDDIN